MPSKFLPAFRGFLKEQANISHARTYTHRREHAARVYPPVPCPTPSGSRFGPRRASRTPVRLFLCSYNKHRVLSSFSRRISQPQPQPQPQPQQSQPQPYSQLLVGGRSCLRRQKRFDFSATRTSQAIVLDAYKGFAAAEDKQALTLAKAEIEVQCLLRHGDIVGSQSFNHKTTCSQIPQ